MEKRRQKQLAAEAALLNRGLDFWSSVSPDSQLAISIDDAPLDAPGVHMCKEKLSMHTVEYHRDATADTPALVCLHGFGFGAALYYASLPAISGSNKFGRLFAVDMLGCGLSSRPRWPFSCTAKCDIDLAERWFVDALEAWRISVGLESFVLLGHSIGGYLAVAYAERYPKRCLRLILASPVGVPEPPSGLSEWVASRPLFFRLAFALWRRGASPYTLANTLGRGRQMMTGYITRRFADGPSWLQCKQELIEYLVQCIWCGGPHSAGGYLHSTILQPGGIPEGSQGEFVYARKPLGKRLLKLDVQCVSCIYGEHDWMFWRNLKDVIEEADGSGGPRMELFRVAQGSHQHMIDNPLGFADAVLASGSDAAHAVGVGFGSRHGAEARVWKRKQPLPQDNDPIAIWAEGHEPLDARL